MDSTCSNNNLQVTTRNCSLALNGDEKINELVEKLKENSPPLEVSLDFILNVNRESKVTSIKPLNRDELTEKDIINVNPHPYFSKITKPKIEKKEILDYASLDEIIVFSPHPDDDILGTCSLLFHSFKAKKDIKVIYMTSGKSAGDPGIRQREALNSIKVLGGNEENIGFTNMPFYQRTDRQVKDDDYEHARELLRKYKPKCVFLCSDMFDPNETHRKCFESLFKVLSEDKEFEGISVYFYYSVWYWPEDDEFSHILPYGFEIYKCKIIAMLEHESQILTNFMGNDPRPFYQRASARDSKIGHKHGENFCEIFYKYR